MNYSKFPAVMAGSIALKQYLEDHKILHGQLTSEITDFEKDLNAIIVMASIAIMVGGAVINSVAFIGGTSRPWPNFDVPTPNVVHQADLLFLPQDKPPCGRKVFLKGAETSTAAGSPRARVTKEMENHKTAIRRGRVDIHRDQAIVERFNRTRAERLFAATSTPLKATRAIQLLREWLGFLKLLPL